MGAGGAVRRVRNAHGDNFLMMEKGRFVVSGSIGKLTDAAHYALGRRHLESQKRVPPSQPAQVWYEKFRVFWLPPGDTRSPTG
jgi:hypothetical protein